MDFAWDAAKAATNVRKHGVSFEEASSAFYDPFAITVRDERCYEEPRWKTTGTSARLRVLIVVNTDRAGNVIRIISARRATRAEVTEYEEELRRRTRGDP